MKAMAYLRVSTQQQADDKRNGYDRQLQIITEYAQKNGVKVAEVYKESWTGTEMDRPVFKEMIAQMLNTKDVRTILVESMDRFSRDAIKGWGLVNDLLLSGVDLVDCSTGESMNEQTNGHPMKEIMQKFKMLLGEAEKKMLSYRLRMGREKASEKQGHYIAGRKQQYETPFLNRLKRMRDKGMTYSQIADKLNKEGIKTVTDLEWSDVRVSSVIRSIENQPKMKRRVIK